MKEFINSCGDESNILTDQAERSTMKQRQNIITVGDAILMGSLVGLAVLSMVPSFASRSTGTYAVIESENRPIQRLALTHDQIVSVTGPLGETLVEVRGGKIRIKRSPCPHQVCVEMGFREKSGEVIACIPNRIAVRIIRGEKESDVDGVTR
jgi:hypothetical protein